MSYNTIARWRIRRFGFHPPRPMMAPTVKGGIVISWCGMRGIVTLATAFALATAAFPHRDLIVFTAFAVVLRHPGRAGPDLAAAPALVRPARRRSGGARGLAGAQAAYAPHSRPWTGNSSPWRRPFALSCNLH